MRNWLSACAPALCATSLLYAQAAAPARPAPAKPAPTAPQQPAATKQEPLTQSRALPSARSIVEKYVQAIGGRTAVLAHSSSHATGTFTVAGAGISGTIDIYNAKPAKSLVKSTIGGIGEILEGFDGTHGWGISPMTGPSLAEGVELDQKRFDADFYSDLHDDGRFTSMKTLEKTTFDGRPAYKVSMVKKIGGEDLEYFDVETGFKIGTTGSREGPMGPMNITVSQTDYKKFGDVMVPTTLKQSVSGVQNVITIKSMEFDNVPESTFDIPDKIKALIK
jgi:hypothetical protein